MLIFQNPTASSCGRPQSPNNCSSAWTDCSHSSTDWQIFANNCHLIYNICVSLIIGARLNWLPTGCIVVIFLYNSNVAEHLWHFTVKSPAAISNHSLSQCDSNTKHFYLPSNLNMHRCYQAHIYARHIKQTHQ